MISPNVKFPHESQTTAKVLETIREAVEEMSRAVTTDGSTDRILSIALEYGLKIVGQDSTFGSVGLLNFAKGTLDIKNFTKHIPPNQVLGFNDGICGEALEQEKPILVGNVRNNEWKDKFIPIWKDTKSELAVPILVKNAEIRDETQIKYGTRKFGVLNLENPKANAFNEADKDALFLLASQAALLIDKRRTDKKLTNLREVERKILGERNWQNILEIVGKGIHETLEFDFVNISLVDKENNEIKTEYIYGLSDEESKEFKRLAVHKLNSYDIQAYLYREPKVIAPPPNYTRFDRVITNKFNLKEYTRIFVPMQNSTTKEVIGTVEAAYKREYGPFIYERDVQILQRFVDYAVEAVWQKQSEKIDKICHELRAPLVGLRSNTQFLRLCRNEINENWVGVKLDDMELDCEILFHNIEELEYILGGSRPQTQPKRTFVMRDIVLKTINQLKPMVKEFGFDHRKVIYYADDARKLDIVIDRVKINQVVYVLLVNAIRYAEENPNEFQIRVRLRENRDAHFILFEDWGIGIKKELKEFVFGEGNRSPEARKKYPNGSGLGLTIAQNLMREMGGDLILANNQKPTQFQVKLPKSNNKGFW